MRGPDGYMKTVDCDPIEAKTNDQCRDAVGDNSDAYHKKYKEV